VVVPNGVDTKRFHPAVEPERVDGLNDRFIVGFTGSFKPWHGLDTLLETFRLLLERSAKYHLLLVGDGPLRSWIEGYIRGARLQKRVTITGWLPYKRLPSVIQRMAVAVAPFAANEEFYFSPLKLFEYMAVGKPVVASRLGQIERVIRPGVTGLLARPGDARDWADKIERLRRDLALRKKLGLAATQEAARHTWEQNARRVTACAEPLLRKR
jgi:glycosyltransferase involved in cell wall biosynthesis